MRNKLFFILLFCLFSFRVNAQVTRLQRAQIIPLQKNGTLKTYKLSHNKKLSLIYKSDTGLISYKGKISNYKFPYLSLKRKADTIIIDVRKIEEIRFTSPHLVSHYIAAFLTANLTIGLISNVIVEDFGTSYLQFFYAIIPTTLAYICINTGYRKFNTKTEWSFY